MWLEAYCAFIEDLFPEWNYAVVFPNGSNIVCGFLVDRFAVLEYLIFKIGLWPITCVCIWCEEIMKNSVCDVKLTNRHETCLI